MWGRSKPIKSLLAGVLVMGVVGCAHTKGAGSEQSRDPLEPFNRSIFAFNEKIDEAAIKPAAQGYKKVVPGRVRSHVGNFFRNLQEPTTIVNDLLQGNIPQAANDLMRFTVNSTFGLLGLLDIATPMGLDHHEEDFGQTLRVWGVGSGPYLVLPLWGPSTVTDGVGLVPAALYTDPRTAVDDAATSYGLLTTNVVDSRARALGASKLVDLQLDAYVFRRETYLQRREDMVHNGEPPLEDDWD